MRQVFVGKKTRFCLKNKDYWNVLSNITIIDASQGKENASLWTILKLCWY